MLGRYYACSVVGWVYALGLVVAAMSTYHCYYWKLRPVLISPLLIAGSPQYDPIVTSSRRRSVHSSKLMEKREPMGTTRTTAAYTTKQAKKGMSQEEDLLSFYGKK
jgi:hypothetical protein